MKTFEKFTNPAVSKPHFLACSHGVAMFTVRPSHGRSGRLRRRRRSLSPILGGVDHDRQWHAPRAV
jgi:hypothetical protein